MYTKIAASLLAVAVMASGLSAEDDSKDKRKSLYRASNLTGKYVMNGTGDNAENLGDIQDIVINLNDGKVIYYVLSHGETLGFGGKYFAVAPEALRLSDDGRQFVLNGVSSKDLDNKKGFDANKWPQEPDRTIGKGERGTVDKAVKEVKKAVDGKLRIARTSRIIGMAVRTPENKSLGSVWDLAMNVEGEKHRVAYAAVSYGGTLGIGGKLYAVPLDKMTLKSPELRPSEQAFVINTTQDNFKNLTGYTSNETWPVKPDEKFWGKVNREDRKEKNRD